uniref:Uncharacterized protein n=2 Tax=Caenorhabditis japonica TaxID=281687 RepID=A0A8R1HLF6_CAEJA
MSIDRGDRIILMMIRSLCCCSQRTKVGDSSDEIIAKQLLKNVFIVCTQNVLTRALTGKLIASLEDRHLIPVHLKLIRPTQEVIDKSNVLKDERRRQLSDAWMLLVFRGREAQSRVTECIKQFKQQYSLHKQDIYWSSSEQEAKHEEDLWFPWVFYAFISRISLHSLSSDKEMEAAETEPTVSNLTQMAVEGDQPPAESELISVKEEDERASEGNSVMSTEGPQLSVASSRIPSPEHDLAPIVLENQHQEGDIKVEIVTEDNGPTAEVISDTAVILEPVNPSPTPVIMQQPTKIE